MDRDDLQSAFNLVFELIPHDDIAVFSLRHSPATVYSTLTTLLMLTLQRLGGGLSLEAVVREAVAEHPHLFPDNKRVREGKLSTNPSAFIKARQRLDVKAVEHYCDIVAKSIIERCPVVLQGRAPLAS